MAVVEKRISDLSGTMSDDMGRLTVLSHPKFSGPIQLDVLDDEIRDMGGLGDIVEVEVTSSTGQTRKLILSAGDFNKLASDMEAVLTEAVARTASHRTVTTRKRGRGRPARQDKSEKVDYAAPEHAGFPHRGRVSPEEAAYVREHFDEVQRRLSEAGVRVLDPADPKTKERYGL
ncbi:MAG TPA: hypothetical protein VEP73_12440 [Actinomycetota bacterium]|jgi:hypothetical protein|nr:hypothetical protein [Actinomycetota bacterium]